MSTAKLICCYCKNYRLRDETTPVPKDGKLLKAENEENEEVENRIEPEDMEVIEEVDNLAVGQEPEVNHLEPEENIENEADENEDPRMAEVAAARGIGKEHPHDEEEQPNQEEEMDCEVDENQLVVAVEEGPANVIERAPERIEVVHRMNPMKHCYMCASFSEDQTPDPESLVRTYTCEECVWSPFYLRT